MLVHQTAHAIEMKEEPLLREKTGKAISLGICDKIRQCMDNARTGTQRRLSAMKKESITKQVEKDLENPDLFGLQFYERPQSPSGSQIPLFSGNLDRGMYMMSDLLSQGSAGPSKQWPVLVIDGLATVPASQRKVLGLDRLFDLVKQHSDVGIIVYEPTDEAEEQNLDHLVDVAIELREHPLEGSVKYLINEMHILKARYQDPTRGWHQYKMRNWGLEFFPSIHFQVQMPGYMPVTYSRSLGPLTRIVRASATPGAQPEVAGKSILEGLVGGMDNGSVTVLLGSRGSFKSQLCIDFLTAGALDGKNGLFVSLIDNFKNLDRNMLCPRFLCRKKCTKGNQRCNQFIHLFHQRPGCITPAEFLYYVKKRLDVKPDGDAKALDRLVFWDLTQLDYRFPMLIDDSMFIPALLDCFKFATSSPAEASQGSPKHRSLRSVIMGAGNARYTRAVSAMADNVFYCWKDSLRSRGSSDDCYRTGAPEVRTSLDLTTTDTFTECLLIYVDRRERHHEMGRNNLYAFPVVGGQLRLPGHTWKPDMFSTEAEHFLGAEEKIQKIYEQQGLE
jgi:hypothetical protein